MPSATYQLFERAMVERKQITCTYEGYHREICPHILGHRNNNEVALTYQFAGVNSAGTQVTGDWKCLYLSKVGNAQLRDGPWYGGSDHSQNQTCVRDVDLDVNPNSPYEPKRQMPAPALGGGTLRRDPLDKPSRRGTARPNTSTRDAWIRALQWTSTIAVNPTRLLADVIDEFAPAHTEDKALLSAEGRSLSFSELARKANRYSRWALERLAKGEVVCLIIPNRPEYVAIWLGITRVGAIVALINTNLAGASLAHAITSVSPRYVIVAAEVHQALHEAFPGSAPFETWVHQQAAYELAQYPSGPLAPSERRPVTIHDTALLIYTSGTTGLPKAAKITHHRILQWSLWFAGLGNFQPNDRMYNCLPLYHSVGGIVAVCSVLVAGGSVIIAEKFSASRFWPDIVHYDCTLFQYIGELCRYLLSAPPSPEERSHPLRLACGNGLRADIWTNFKERFAIPEIIEFYAASEGTFSLFNIEDEPGAIGHMPAFLAPRFPAVLVRYDAEREQPYRDKHGRCVRCAANEVGEALGRITVKQDSVGTRFDGYLNAAETERKILRDVFEDADAWYRTGDLMRMDERGFIYFVDRIGDTFRWKGENVSTLEVAEALSGCPGVTDIVVYGVEVPGADGRAGMAAVTAQPDLDLQALHSLAKERLPSYARPVFIRLCRQIEVTETFKPKKQALMSEGFDPRAISDRICVEDRAADAYVPLDEAIYAAIQRGEFRV
jgi:fatty-acyl-CoA synthase